MDLRRFPLVDSSLSLLLTGYSWLPSRWRRSEKPVVHARLLGRHAVALRGPEAVPFFYDERNIRREGAVPSLVQDTLFGRDAVHTLDGEPHRVRKGMFVSLLMEPRRVAALAESAGATWDKTATSWTSKPSVVLFDETSRIITEAVCRWADVPLEQDEVPRRATDPVATIDGFATLTLRHWRARLARFRLEKRVGSAGHCHPQRCRHGSGRVRVGRGGRPSRFGRRTARAARRRRRGYSTSCDRPWRSRGT